MRARSSCSGAQ